MAGKVQVDLDVNDAKSVAAWLRGRQSIQAFNSELGKTDNKNRNANRSSSAMFSSIGRGVATTLAGFASIHGALQLWQQAQQEIIDQQRVIGKSLDVNFRSFLVQTGLRGVEGERAKERIFKAAEAVPLSDDPVAFATSVGKQLASSGFSADEAQGSALLLTLKGLAASNIDEGDPTQLVQALGQFLAAQGLEKNTKNLETVLVAAQRLFKDTDLQVVDLSQLAGKSAGFAGALSVQETLAVFDVLRQKTTAEKASTAEQIIIGNLQTAGADNNRKAALKKLGLKADDVDLIGEGIGEVLDKLAAGFEKAPEKERATILEKLFGKEAKSAAAGLIRERGQIPGLIEKFSNKEGFESDAAFKVSGRVAAGRRQKVREQRALLESDQETDLLLGALKEIDRERGLTAFQRKVREEAFNKQLALGLSAQDAALVSFDILPGGYAGQTTDAQNRVRLDKTGEQRIGNVQIRDPAIEDDPRQQTNTAREAAARKLLEQAIADSASGEFAAGVGRTTFTEVDRQNKERPDLALLDELRQRAEESAGSGQTGTAEQRALAEKQSADLQRLIETLNRLIEQQARRQPDEPRQSPSNGGESNAASPPSEESVTVTIRDVRGRQVPADVQPAKTPPAAARSRGAG